MSTTIKKDSIHFTIDKNINIEFNKYIEDNCINRSSLLQTLIENFLKNNKKVY